MDIYILSVVSLLRALALLLTLYSCVTVITAVQFKMVSMRLEKPICAPPRLSEVSPTLILSLLRALPLLLVL